MEFAPLLAVASFLLFEDCGECVTLAVNRVAGFGVVDDVLPAVFVVLLVVGLFAVATVVMVTVVFVLMVGKVMMVVVAVVDVKVIVVAVEVLVVVGGVVAVDVVDVEDDKILVGGVGVIDLAVVEIIMVVVVCFLFSSLGSSCSFSFLESSTSCRILPAFFGETL